ncbi:hypothetical protein [Halopenitus sp. POP-27]|uniref:DUF7261 family protein n=1 Tax=Halopenitus sp. POP-27 TaxID=2994425 RepID=UPI00246992B2|nr:hypothetical protein [Halopenitus sp. POP-27]
MTLPRTGRSGSGGHDRGQLVLLAAVTLALALVPLSLAYLQLGYAGDIDGEPAVETTGTSGAAGGAGPESGTGSSVIETIDRTVTVREGDIAGAYEWSARDAAVSAYRDGLDADLDVIEGASLEDGTVLAVTVAPAVATSRAESACPGGPNRVFGACEADRGVVVQDRAGTTTIVAVALEIRIRRAGTRTTMTIVATPWA